MKSKLQHAALSTLSKDEKAFADMIFQFAQEKVAPLVHEMDKNSKLDKSIVPALFELGLMGIEVPMDYDGSEASFMMATLAVESLARVDPSVAVVVDVQNTLVNNALIRWCNDEQKARILPKMATEWVGSYALSEPSSGSDAFALKCKAEKVEGGWKLNGTKLWITNGGESQLFIVMANTDFSKGYKGITSFLVQRGMEGFIVGEKEDKMGIRGSDTHTLLFNDVKVPKENRIGEDGFGFKFAMKVLSGGRIGIAAQALGIAAGALELSTAYSKERKAFGKEIYKHQAIAFKLADMATETEAARLLVYKSALDKDMGRNYDQSSAMAKLYASKVAMEQTVEAVQIHGGYGYVKEFHVERLMRDAKITQIYEGTSEIQRIVIARSLLK